MAVKNRLLTLSCEPTPERQKRVRDVEDALSAHEQTLVALLRASASQTEVPDQLHRLIVFAPSTPAIKAALIEITQRSDASRSAALDAYNTLFKLKLDDDKLRQDVTTKIGFRDELHTRADQANELLVNAATQWGMAEMEPLFRDFLSVPYKLENYPKRGGRAKLQTHYELAVRGLAAFGKRAASFADLLKARLAEMDPAEDADLINACKETILIIEGKVNPKPMINLKGQLLGVSQVAWLEWRTTHGVDAAAMSQTTKDAALSVLSQTASKKTPEAKPTPTTPSNEPTSSAPWSIIAMLIVAAIGLLWLLVKKRN